MADATHRAAPIFVSHLCSALGLHPEAAPVQLVAALLAHRDALAQQTHAAGATIVALRRGQDRLQRETAQLQQRLMHTQQALHRATLVCRSIWDGGWPHVDDAGALLGDPVTDRLVVWRAGADGPAALPPEARQRLDNLTDPEARAARTEATHDAARDVLAEVAVARAGQISREGYTTAHDDQTHADGTLAAMAEILTWWAHQTDDWRARWPDGTPPPAWPVEPEAWKPKNPRHALLHAAALIVADIEIRDRAALKPT